MDASSLIFSKNKQCFTYKNEIFNFTEECRNKTLLFTCKVEGCNAKIKLNHDYSKIVVHSFVHDHLKRFSPNNPLMKNSPSNQKPPQTKSKDVINPHRVADTTPTSAKTPAATSISVTKTGLISRDMTLAHNKSINDKIDNKSNKPIQYQTITSDNKLVQTDMSGEEWTNTRDGLVDKIAKQEMEILQLREKVSALERELALKNNSQTSTSKNSHGAPRRKVATTEPARVHMSRSTNTYTGSSKCFLIGDSHVRGLAQQFQDVSLDSQWTFESVFHPGAGFEAVADAHVRSPNLVSPSSHDTVIIMCGTNDICSSSWDAVRTGIDTFLNKFNHCKSLCVIGVPLRLDNTKLNKHITKFNTKVKNYIIRENSSLCYIDPTRLLKRHQYRYDGIHLNLRGKHSLCVRIRNVFLSKRRGSENLPHITSPQSSPARDETRDQIITPTNIMNSSQPHALSRKSGSNWELELSKEQATSAPFYSTPSRDNIMANTSTMSELSESTFSSALNSVIELDDDKPDLNVTPKNSVIPVISPRKTRNRKVGNNISTPKN